MPPHELFLELAVAGHDFLEVQALIAAGRAQGVSLGLEVGEGHLFRHARTCAGEAACRAGMRGGRARQYASEGRADGRAEGGKQSVADRTRADTRADSEGVGTLKREPSDVFLVVVISECRVPAPPCITVATVAAV